MTNTTTPIAKWYTGKALATILTYVIPTLERAMEDGYWQPGDSRKVKAALNKQAVAERFGRSHERYTSGGRPNESPSLLSNVGAPGANHNDTGWALVHAMMFGQVGAAPRLLDVAAQIAPYATTPAAVEALSTARQWAMDFAPIAKLMARLDATRPKPVYIMGSISPTVMNNVGKAMAVDLTSIQCPETETTWVEMEWKGQMVRMPVLKILWPEGTRHNVSRFAYGSNAGNCQCEACGHAIKSGLFVPLLATTPTGPISLWVGRDCARNLFAVDVKGDALYTSGPAAVAS